MNRTKLRLLLFPVLLLPLIGFGQISEGGTPRGLSADFQRAEDKELKPTRLKRPDLEKARREDESLIGSRFTLPLPVDYSLENAGKWVQLKNGDWLWRLKLKAPKARGLAVLYDRFYLPPGSKLFMYSQDGEQIRGAYTSRNNKRSGKFMTGLIRGEEAIIEYYEPQEVRGQGQLHIFRVDYAYRDDFIKESSYRFKTYQGGGGDFGFGASQPCHENANCLAQGDQQDYTRGVCRILVVVEEGMGFCSGSLVNNTQQDGRPYVLSAFHCQDGFTPEFDFWRFDFNYESQGCVNPQEEPAPNSLLGCREVAGYQASDFLLLEMDEPVPSSYNVFYNGWSRKDTVTSSSINIHHPLGDIKKLTVIDRSSQVFDSSIEWDNDVITPPDHHLIVQYEDGTFELGSSGSPFFDQNGRIAGQLHGGSANCGSNTAYFGRIAVSWEGGGTPQTRLKDWLDPNNTDRLVLDGEEINNMGGTGVLAGTIALPGGAEIPGVAVTLTGVDARNTTSNEEGRFVFNDVPFGLPLNLQTERNGEAGNGLSTLDLIRVRKHILGVDPFDNPYQYFAADVNGSNSISTMDLIYIQRVILQLDNDFPDVRLWQFLPEDLSFEGVDNPFDITFPSQFPINDFSEDNLEMNIVGWKAGDVNFSVSFDEG